MITRTISLTPYFDTYVDEAVASGRFHDASEMVAEALSLLRDQEQNHAAKMERLRAALQVGEDDIAAGRFDVINTNEELEAYFDDIWRELEAEWAQAEQAARKSSVT